MNSKAQASMEFLMTYGWAVFGVFLVVGALAYFGVLNPQSILPERCELRSGFYCKDYLVHANADTGLDGIDLTIQNGGPAIVITQVKAAGIGTAAGKNCSFSLPIELGSGEKYAFHLLSDDLSGGGVCDINSLSSGKHTFNILIIYNIYGSGASHAAAGTLFARRE